MWRKISVRNFQSLKEVDLILGKFTVILGPTSSGKSALVRALRALVSNARGSAFTTRGEKTTVVTVATDRLTVSLERSGSTGAYTVTEGSSKGVFTKLGGAVPPVVSARLRVPPVDGTGSLHFAEQFDRPFLLDESGATVARVLGELTNVNLIFEAAREANRRRLNISRDLTTRKNDLKELVEKANTFRSLPKQLEACTRAEDSVIKAQHLSNDIRNLRNLVSDVEIASRELAKVEVPEIPSIELVETNYSMLTEFRGLIREWTSSQSVLTSVEKMVIDCESRVIGLVSKLDNTLVEAGFCPTCQRPV